MLVPLHQLGDVVDRGAARKRNQLGSRHHHVMGSQVGQVERPLDSLLRRVAHHARFSARGHGKLQLLRGLDEGMAGGWFDSEQAHDGVPQAVEGRDREPEHSVEPVNRARDREGCRLRALEREALGRQLPQHDVQRRNDGEGECSRHRVGRHGP